MWVTKYRYHVLQGEIAQRARDIIRASCMQHEVLILKGHVSRDHVQLFVSAPPSLAVSDMLQSSKGKSSRKLQEEYPTLNTRYGGRHLWARGSCCASAGTVTDEMITTYIEQHERPQADVFTVAAEAQ